MMRTGDRRLPFSVDEGAGEKGGGLVRTEEVRKWDEGPSGEVEGNECPH